MGARDPGRLALALLSGAALAFVFSVDPSASPLTPPCLFKALFDVSCPGCGSLRALHHLLHGNVRAAWELQPFLLMALPVAGMASPLFREKRGPFRAT